MKHALDWVWEIDAAVQPYGCAGAVNWTRVVKLLKYEEKTQ